MTLKSRYTIREAIQKLAKNAPPALYIAEVLSVNKANGTMRISSPWFGEITISYQATEGAGKFVLWAAVGSYVVVGRLEQSDKLCVIATIDPEEVWLRGGEWSMVRGDEAEREMKKLNSNINLLQQATRALAVVLDGLGAVGTSVAFDTAMAAKQSQVLTDFKNEKVRHG